MSRLVVLRPESADAAAVDRLDLWRRCLGAAGHRLVEVEVGDDGDLAGRICAAQADAILALAWPAAVAAARLDHELPLWVDLADGATAAAEVGEGRDVHSGWWLVAAVLDRLDLVTCASGVDQARLVAWLGLRGRFDHNFDAGELVRVVPSDPMPGFDPGLEQWWSRPERADGSYAPAVVRERRAGARAEALAAELARIRASLGWRLARLPARALGGLAAAVSALGRWLLRGASWLFLLVATVRLLAAARLRARAEVGPTAEGLVRPTRRPRLLIVMPYPLVPTDHGGAVRVVNLIRHLEAHCDIHLLVLVEEGQERAHREVLEPLVERLWLHRWRPRFELEAEAFEITPPSVRLFHDERVALKIRDIVEHHRMDIVQLEYTEMAQYREAAGDAAVILVEHDVAFLGFQRRRRLGLPRRFPASRVFGATFRHWMALLRFEVEACRAVDQVQVMSAADGGTLARHLGDGGERVRVVPNGVDAARYRPPEPAPERAGVLMVGNFHTLPNLDGLDWFAAEIWPLVRRRRPAATLAVVGAKMPPKVHRWHGENGITVVGAVPDLGEWYHRHRVLVVPLRVGSGTRLKLHEAFASGIPTVSTGVGAEGIEVAAGEHLLLADDAEAFAAAVDRLLGDDALATRLAVAARRLAEEEHDWSVAAGAALAAIHQLLPAEPPARAEPVAEHRASRVFGAAGDGPAGISVIIPTLRGGALLERCLDGLASQRCPRPFEVVCVDSGSPEEELEGLRRRGVRLYRIEPRHFNHGLTRDLGADLAGGEVLVFLNQDAIPADEHWLDELTAPLFAEDPPAAVQGRALEHPEGGEGPRPFYWDTGGPRFYFTREMHRWVGRHPGPSFSTVCAAIRREVWRELPFGWAPIMEDKKWQRLALEAGLVIADAPRARVWHSHEYGIASLVRRCQSEGFGWRLLGEHYRLGDMLRDLWHPRLWRDLARGLRRRRLGPAEVLFPWLRPLALWHGNRRLKALPRSTS